MKPKFFVLFIIILTNINLLYSSQWRDLSENWIAVDSVWNVAYRGISCADTLNCIAAGYNGGPIIFRRTTDGGYTWNTTWIDTIKFWGPRINCIAYPNTSLCLVTRDSGRVFRSTDQGETWTLIQTPATRENQVISMYDKNYGVTSDYSVVCLTENGGLDWKKLIFPDSLSTQGIMDVSFPAPNTIFVLLYYHGERLILRSIDLGKNWETNLGPTSSEHIFFTDSLNGWVSSTYNINVEQYAAVIYHTSDGGRSWVKQLDTLQPNLSNRIFQICFHDKNNGYAVGVYDGIYKTTNGGKFWDYQTKYRYRGIYSDLRGIAYPGLNSILIADVGSKIYKYFPTTNVNDDFTNNKIIDDLNIFPNPVFNEDNLNICFYLNLPSNIKISIMNYLGIKVEESFEGFMDLGHHKISTSLSNVFNPGVYFLEFKIGNNIETRKFIIIR